jgi:hypothetical protein
VRVGLLGVDPQDDAEVGGVVDVQLLALLLSVNGALVREDGGQLSSRNTCSPKISY